MSKKLDFLNTREIKELNKRLEVQHGCKFNSKLVFVKGGKDRILIVNRDIETLPLERLRIDKLGLYVCTDSKFGLRLSMEGSQMLGPGATKNVLELDDKQSNEWLMGKDVEFEDVDIKKVHDSGGDLDKFFVVKHNSDYLGSGKFKDNTLMNYVPKERRTGASF
jgi:NOL1/NOP2/fmu family ribosome biogenesis protein